VSIASAAATQNERQQNDDHASAFALLSICGAGLCEEGSIRARCKSFRSSSRSRYG
jgi:hypothetical protein